ncbi:alpha/beta fold hydrolase [Pseudomonas sp. CDFA 602]|uniref:alpha/beta fold hydrolase n=1 Tax=Pseudomonas californiensis TaxID=2829823 RepID=UPI001E35633C|nr:alpha/beta fold hydrolase [Pseudomonas californiensis]MCD5994260.1 alpha/beta fold hydrolase [Pseudomonas californiensis]MCD5999641.1 alpha/beta fold hydrolase [Pseudomonas californiensis]
MQRLISQPAKGLLFVLLSFASCIHAAPLPPATEGDWVAPEFTFHTGEKFANLKLHYTTLGDPKNPAILFLHGTYRPGSDILSKDFGGELFGPGQPLSASKYYIISTDGIGVGQSSKPSDGLRTKFPEYNYTDMVQAQYRLVTEGLGVKHLRLIIGNSMGGMQTWMWGQTWPHMMDALVPMASQPTAMSSRNWMMRRLLVESIKQDPAWNNGNYTSQPPSLRLANAMFSIGTSGGALAYQAIAPTRALADRFVDERLNTPQTSDANDFIYQWQSSADYDASQDLSRIQAPVLAINSADDERNPPETGLLEASLREVKNAKLLLIPASPDTRGHGTTSMAKFYSKELEQFMQKTEKGRVAGN